MSDFRAPVIEHRENDVVLGFVDNGSVATCFMSSVLKAFAYDASREAMGYPRRLVEYANETGPYIHDNRSRLARYFLEHTDKQWLWMIDNDIEFPENAVHQLLDAAEEHEIGILGGAYWNQYPGSNRYLSWLVFTPRGILAVPELPENREVPLPVTAVGMGMTLIHRQVLQAVSDMYPNDPWDTFAADMLVQFEDGTFLIGRTPDDFDEGQFEDREVTGTQRMGEDVTFPVAPDTPVLAADWAWRPISSYEPGQEILAFDEHSPGHSSRRWQRAVVEDVIEKRLPRVRIITDHREIITTTEHPWLTRRHPKWAWHWSPAGNLEVGASLASVLAPEQNPDLSDDDYAAGYVQGLIQSDGTRTPKQFVVRVKDSEPLERMATMLARLGIESVRGASYWDGDPRHARMERLSVNDWLGHSWLDGICSTTKLPSRAFAAGFLAGFFDGDGSHHGGKLQIHNISDRHKDRLEDAARMLGVPFTGRGHKSVWMHGQDRIFRFWQLTLPALSRRTNPIGQVENNGLGRTGQEVLHRPEVVVAIENLPPADVVCLKTTSSTFVADGLASHNCIRAQRAGFRAYGLPSLVVDHFKTHKMLHGRSDAEAHTAKEDVTHAAV